MSSRKESAAPGESSFLRDEPYKERIGRTKASLTAKRVFNESLKLFNLLRLRERALGQ